MDCSVCWEGCQGGKKDGHAATKDLGLPIGSSPPSIDFILRQNGHAEVSELLDSLEGIGFPLPMSITLGMCVQAFSSLPQGPRPVFEQLMRLRPVVALLNVDMIADVLAALDLSGTCPLPIHTTRKTFTIEDGTRALDVNAPDARPDTIIGTSIRGILRRSCSQLDCHTCFQVP